MSDLSIQGEVVVDSSKAESAFDRVGNAAEQMSREVEGAAGKAGQAVDKIGDGAATAASSFTRSEAAIVASARRSTEALQLLGKTASEKLEFKIDAKGFDRAKFEPALQALREVEAQAERAQQAATGSLNKMGVSAGQTQAALRQLPAQFSDIVVSLQSGQAPLTVFLQQGAQIKDSFGGAGNAVRAMGGYVLSLVNPLTVAGVAAAGLGYAFVKGGQEAKEFNQALVLTGNTAGTSVGQLQLMAKSLSDVAGGQGAASKALTEFVSTAKVGSENLERFTSIAIQFEKVAGVAVADTAKQFRELAEDPVKAVLKLNDSMNFLTKGTYDNIKALVEQGRTTDAANLAQKTYADTLDQNKGKILAGLGDIEKAWMKVKSAISGAIDSLLSIGRAQEGVARLASARGELATLETTRDSRLSRGFATGDLEPQIAAKKQYIDTLREEVRATERANTERARGADILKLYTEYDKQGDEFKTKAAKRQEERTKAEVEGRQLIAAGMIQEADLRQRLADIDAKYKDAPAKRAGKSQEQKDLEDTAKLFDQLAGLSSDFRRDWDLTAAAFKRGEISMAQLEQQQAKMLAKQPFAVALTKEQNEALRAQAKISEDAAKGYAKYIEEIERGATAAQQQVDKMILEEEAAALASEGYLSLAQAIEAVTIKRLEEKQEGLLGNEEAYLSVQKEIDARKELIGLIGRKEDRKRDDDFAKDFDREVERARKKHEQEMDRYIEDTSRGLGDAIEIAITDGSKAGGEKMREVLQEALLRKPLRMFIDGVMNQVTGGALQLLGIGGGGAGGGGSNLFGLASNASSLYNGASTVGSVFSGAQGLGTLSSFQAGYSGAVLPASMVGPSIQAPTVMSNLGYMSNTGTLAGGSGGGGAGMGVMGGMGVFMAIALALGNIVGVFRSERMIGSGLAGRLDGSESLTPWEEWRDGGTLVSGPEFNTHNPLAVLKSQRERLAEMRERGEGETPYAMAIQANITNLEKETKGLEVATAKQSQVVQKGYEIYRKNVVDMANGLGLAGDSIKDFVYELGAQDLNFKDLNTAQIEAKIAETFGKAGTEMVEGLLGSWREVTDVMTTTYQTEQMTQASDGAYVTETTSTKRMEYVASVYAKTGETAIETLTRLSTSFHTLNEASDALGFGIYKGSLALADFADDFIEAFGGLERFTSTTSAYMQAYYSDEERRQALLRSGARQANRAGLTNVTAESLEQLGQAGIRAFIDGLVAGGGTAEEIADAMDLAVALAPAFASVEAQTPVVQELSNVVDELTQSYQNAIKSLTSDRDSLAVDVLRAQGDEAGAKALERTQYLAQFAGLDDARRKEIETLYDGNMATRAYIEGIKAAAQAQLDALAKLRADSLALIDGAAGKTDAAMAAYERAADKERERLQGVIDTVRSVFQAAEDGAKSFFGEVEAVARFQGAEGRDFISQALASARAGGALPDGKELSDAIAAVGKDFSATQFTSQAEADFQRLVVANELKGLQTISGDQLTEAEKQLEALNKQVEWAREQVSALRDIDTKLKTLPEAIADLILAYNTEAQTRANVGAKAIIGTGDAIYNKELGTGKTSSGEFFDASEMAEVARDVIAANGAAGKGSVLDALEGKGFTMPQYNEMFGLPPGTLEAEAKALGRPIYHSGTTYVPETGFALLQQGEAVIPAAYNPFNGGSGGMGDSTAVVNEIRALREDNRAQAGQLIRLQTQLNKVLKQWDGDGLPEERETTA